MRRRELLALFRRHALELAELDGATRAALAPVLRDLRRELETGLREVLRGLSPADTWTRARAVRALAILKMGTGSPDWMRRFVAVLRDQLSMGGTLASQIAQRHLAETLAVVSTRLGKVGMGAMPVPTAAALARRGTLMAERAGHWAQRHGRQVVEDVRRQLLEGVLKGETVRDLAKRMAPRMPTEDPAASAATGLARRAQYRAERLVRTELIHGYNVVADDGLREVMHDDPDIKRRWDAAMDSRVCRSCRALDGQLRGEGEDFLPGVRRPPLHPHCRCILVAWRADWVD
jgi:SPP1 gp7 family putative phage head morphogenesis protein